MSAEFPAAGFALEATLTAIRGFVDDLEELLGGTLSVEPGSGTVFTATLEDGTVFEIEDLPLPTGAATAAAQAAILAKIATPVTSTSYGNKKLAVSGDTALSAVSGGIPAGATKALVYPDAAMKVNDDGTAADANDFPLDANREWSYDGDRLDDVHFFGTGNVYLWFYA